MENILLEQPDLSKLKQLKSNPTTAPIVSLVFAMLKQTLADLLSENQEIRQAAYMWIKQTKTNKWIFTLFGLNQMAVICWGYKLLTEKSFRVQERTRLLKILSSDKDPEDLDYKGNWIGNIYYGDFKNFS